MEKGNWFKRKRLKKKNLSVLIQNERESCCSFRSLFCVRLLLLFWLARISHLSLTIIHSQTKNFLVHIFFSSSHSCADAGIHGFIVVDLPPIEAMNFRQICDERDMCLVPLVSPTTTDERLAIMGKMAKGYVYCVSLNGVTGARTDLPPNLNTFLNRVRVHMR